MYFTQWCEVSAKYTSAFVRNQTLNKTGSKIRLTNTAAVKLNSLIV